MAGVIEERFTARGLAERLGISDATACRWATRWHGPAGSGTPRELTDVDLLVGRAWKALVDDTANGDSPATRLCDLAERTIRANPQRYLVMTGDTEAATYACKAEAVDAWEAAQAPDERAIGRYLDLRPEATA